MKIIADILSRADVVQTIVLLTFISFWGLLLGRVKVGKFSFGGACVFFVAIAAGHFAHKSGIETNAQMMDFAKNFGLLFFVYTLGLQTGPGFFASLKKGGLRLSLSAVGGILLETILVITLAALFKLGAPETVGLYAGSVTNTPMLIAAQETVLDMHPGALEESAKVGAAYATTYPFSVLAVMLCVIILSRLFPESMKKASGQNSGKGCVAVSYHLSGSSAIGKSIARTVAQSGCHFVISRLWRDGVVQIPLSDTVLREGDVILAICGIEDRSKLDDYFGVEDDTNWNNPDIDWDMVDEKLVCKSISVTRPSVVGMTIGDLKLRNKYGVNITRLNRAGITIVPSAATVLQFGDSLTVVGDEVKIKTMGAAMGNEEKRLDEPQVVPLMLGLLLGVVLGSIPVAIPGLSAPLKLGIAGGAIIVGILMGAAGPRFRLTTYTTRSANLMLRQIGITIFFASVGFSVGGKFVETVFCTQGLIWAALSIVIAMVPLLLLGIFNEKVLHLSFAANAGLICGVSTNPNALNYANGIMENDTPAEAYATVYPLVTFLRIFLAQVMILLM